MQNIFPSDFKSSAFNPTRVLLLLFLSAFFIAGSFQLQAQLFQNSYTPNVANYNPEKASCAVTYQEEIVTVESAWHGGLYITKTSASGGVIWKKEYTPDFSPVPQDNFSRITTTQFTGVSIKERFMDGAHSYIACVQFMYRHQDPGSFGFYHGFYVMEISENGVLQWSKAYYNNAIGESSGGFAVGYIPSDMMISYANEIVVCGRFQKNSDVTSSRPFLAKLESDGAVNWFRVYETGGDEFLDGEKVVQDIKNGFIIYSGNIRGSDGNAHLEDYGSDIWAARIDWSDGQPAWFKRYTLPDGEEQQPDVNGLVQTTTSDYAIVAERTSLQAGINKGTLVLSITNAGNVNWSNVYAEQSTVDCFGRHAHLNSGLVISGDNEGEDKSWLLNIQHITGNVQWSRNFSVPDNSEREIVYSDLSLNTDNVSVGLLKAGSLNTSIELIRTDVNGDVFGCESIGTSEKEAISMSIDEINVDVLEGIELVEINDVEVKDITVEETANCCEIELPIEIMLPGPICQQNGTVQLSSSPNMGWWEGAAAGDGIVDPSTLVEGMHAVRFCVNNLECCVQCTTEYIEVVNCTTVDPCGIVSASNQVAEMCAGTTTLSAIPGGGTWSGPALISGSVVDLALLGPGNFTYTYCNTIGSCTDCKTITLTVVSSCSTMDCSTVSVVISGPQTMELCQDPFSLNATPAGGSWYGAIQSNGKIHPQFFEPGSHTFVYCYEDIDGCVYCQDWVIDVIDNNCSSACPGVEIPFTGSIEQCDAPLSLAAFPTGGTWSGPNNFNGVLDPSTFSPGTYRFFYCYGDEAEGWCCCTYTDITIKRCGGEGKNSNPTQFDSSQEAAKPAFAVYPNPSTGILNLEGASANARIVVTSVLGATLLETRANESGRALMALDGLSDGVYFITTTTESGRATETLILND